MIDPTMGNFVGLTTTLTGFSGKSLPAPSESISIHAEYLSFFTRIVTRESGDPQLVDTILQTFAALKEQPLSDQQIRDALLADSNGIHFVLACRKLIFLWYAGVWPAVASTPGAAPTGEDAPTKITPSL